jgi:hypothetical protein
MKYVYYFKNGTDVIYNDGLKREAFNEFLHELRELNDDFNFNIYLMGSYLSYLFMESDVYEDIDFCITAEKIMDVDELYDFFERFHLIAKKYKFIYDMYYLMDAFEDDLNFSANNQHILSLDATRILKLYSHRAPYNIKSKVDNKSVFPDSELFEGLLSINNPTDKFIKNNQRKRIFQKPIKLTI